MPAPCIDPSLVCVQMTTNKAELTRDKANRSSAVRMLKQPPDYKFRSFGDQDLLGYVRSNQELFLGAVFAVIREWHRRGKPRLDSAPHDFRAWATTLGWIVEHLLGAGPLLADHRAIQLRISTPAATWLRDVLLAVKWANKLGQRLRTFQLLEVVQATNVQTTGIELDFDGGDDREFQKACRALGRALKRAMANRDEASCDNLTITRLENSDDEGRATAEYIIQELDPPLVGLRIWKTRRLAPSSRCLAISPA